MTIKELEKVVVNLQQKVAELEKSITTLSVKKGPASTRALAERESAHGARGRSRCDRE